MILYMDYNKKEVFAKRRMAEKQEITENRKGLFIGFLAGVTAAALVTGLPCPKQASLTLRDGDMRKLLIQKGAAYEAEGPVFVEVPWEVIHGEDITVEVTVTNTGDKAKVKQIFTLTGKAAKEQMELTRKD